MLLLLHCRPCLSSGTRGGCLLPTWLWLSIFQACIIISALLLLLGLLESSPYRPIFLSHMSQCVCVLPNRSSLLVAGHHPRPALLCTISCKCSKLSNNSSFLCIRFKSACLTSQPTQCPQLKVHRCCTLCTMY